MQYKLHSQRDYMRSDASAGKIAHATESINFFDSSLLHHYQIET